MLREINGYDGRRPASRCQRYTEMKDDGSTAGGCWIYSGVYADGVNQAARRKPGQRAGPGWRRSGAGRGRRTGASSTTAPPPTRTASRGASARSYVWWDADAGQVDRPRRPRLPGDHRAGLPAARRRQRRRGARRRRPVHHAGRRQGPGCSRRAGLLDGPLPAHYEPHESPVRNPLYRASRPTRPARCSDRKDNRYQPEPAGAARGRLPLRLHHLPAHRAPHRRRDEPLDLPYLSELQPELFCEVSPELAAERGLEHGGWATIVTARTAIEARVLVTDRVAPLRVGGTVIHQVGLPYHWGWRRAGHRRLGQRPVRRHARPERAHPGVQGRAPATSGPAGGRPARRCSTMSGLPRRAGIADYRPTAHRRREDRPVDWPDSHVRRTR